MNALSVDTALALVGCCGLLNIAAWVVALAVVLMVMEG